jgi:pyroglutamyl-peptidase
MPSVLITAFEPYEQWDENSSWLAVVELTRWFEAAQQVTTRRYPVSLSGVHQRLSEDLKAGYDVVLHLGQAPGACEIRLESVGLNLRSDGRPLIEGAPAAYQSTLPLQQWQQSLCDAGIPARVSHHAGTVLCNATLFLCHHLAAQRHLPLKAAFIHIPLTPAQVARSGQSLPSLSTPMAAAALSIILQQILAR